MIPCCFSLIRITGRISGEFCGAMPVPVRFLLTAKNLGNWILVMYFIVGIVVNAVVNDLVRL